MIVVRWHSPYRLGVDIHNGWHGSFGPERAVRCAERQRPQAMEAGIPTRALSGQHHRLVIALTSSICFAILPDLSDLCGKSRTTFMRYFQDRLHAYSKYLS
jgi:hypothetical protein